MRLSSIEINAIKSETVQQFGAYARVFLFGSRVDDSQRGGDIDLLVNLPQPQDHKVRLALRMNARLQMRLGVQKIDIVLLDPQTAQLSIHHAALRTGIDL